MGHFVRERAMISVKEEYDSKFKDDTDDQHNLLSNMVDARACYKPSQRVRIFYKLLLSFIFIHYNIIIYIIYCFSLKAQNEKKQMLCLAFNIVFIDNC